MRPAILKPVARSPAASDPAAAEAVPRFDGVARVYRWAEYLALGPLLKRTREAFLPQLGHCRRALLLGDGDGRFAAALLRSHPGLHACAVDGSAAMLSLLRDRCARDGNASRLQTGQASVLAVVAPPDTDLITTHFLLDCLTQAEVVSLTRRLASQVQPGCLWLVSEFGYPRPRLARWLVAVYLRLLYAAFRVLTGLRPQRLPDPQAALRAAGCTRLERLERLGGFLYSELWQFSSPPAARTQPGVHARRSLTQPEPGSAHQPKGDR